MDTKPSDRELKIEQLEQLIVALKEHSIIQVPDVITFPIIIGVSSTPRTRKPRVALGSDPLPGKKKA